MTIFVVAPTFQQADTWRRLEDIDPREVVTVINRNVRALGSVMMRQPGDRIVVVNSMEVDHRVTDYMMARLAPAGFTEDDIEHPV